MSAREFVNWIKQTQSWPGPFDPSETIFSRLMEHSPQDLRDLYAREAVLAITSAKNSPYARLHKVAPTEWVIEVTGGLIAFLYATAKSVALLIPGPDSDDDEWSNLREGASRMAEVLWWYRIVRSGRPPRFPDDQREDAIAESLAQKALLFFIGHECGHLLHNLRGEHEFAKGAELWPTRKLQHRAEFIADNLGIRLIMELCPLKAGVIEEQLYYGAAELGLHTWALMEKVGFRFERSHPLANQRIELLRAEAISVAVDRNIRRHPSSNFYIPTIMQQATILGNIMKRLSEEILSGKSATAFREDLVEQLDEFLENNHITPIDDSSQVLALIFAVKGFADPPDLLWAAARLAARRADILCEGDELGQSLTDYEIMIEHSKQNLLLRCIDQLMPPHGSVDFLPLLREALSGVGRDEAPDV